jgi:hypothetical protein
MGNKIKIIKKKKINSQKKREPFDQSASTKKSLDKIKKSDEVEALALTWNEDLCE